MEMELHMCNVFNFQSMQSLNSPLGTIPACSMDVGNQGQVSDRA